MMFVTLEEAKTQVRQGLDVDDEQLMLLIQAASASVANYLKDQAPVVDSSGEVDLQGIRPEVKQATLILLAIFYRDPDGQSVADWSAGYLPRPVTSILYPLRDPALA